MRSLSPPPLDHEDLYSRCVNQMSNADKRNQLNALTNIVVQAGITYRQAGENGTLHSIMATQISPAERALMRDLYDKRMVPKGGAGR